MVLTCFKIEQKQIPYEVSEQWTKREMPKMGTKVKKDVMQNMEGNWGKQLWEDKDT